MKKSDLLKIIKEEIDAFTVNEDASANKAAVDAEKMSIDKQILALNKKKQELSRGGLMSETELDEEQLDEMAKITGRLETAIKKVIADNPELEGLPLKKVIRKDAEVVDSLEGDDLYDNQLNKYIALQKGEREVGQRGRKADPNKAPKAPIKTEKPTQNFAKPATDDLTDEDGNKVEVDKTVKPVVGNAEIEAKLKDVISKKKAKLANAKGADYDRELAALKQFLAKPEISKYIKKKTVGGVNPYSIDSILN